MNTNKIYQRHRYHSSIISHCVWLYYRFTLSYRDIELIMMKKGISVTYESIRYWCIKFGKLYAKRIKKVKRYGDYVYMDEVFCKINGKRVYLWRAVDQDGQTIDVLVQEKRDSKAATKFIKKVRKSMQKPVSKVVTDKLKSYIKPIKILLSTTPHLTQQYANNRAENSHQATRLREKKMRKFKSLKQAQLFLSCFGNIYDHFNCARHLCSAKTFRILAECRFKEWGAITQVVPEFQN
ncbi:IS6 family transposase [Orbus mooreae]|uniref:IS6 family transposase n=1 Tax=Orbus mooreae TaxID=3074107 RepID=UPI00370DC0CA